MVKFRALLRTTNERLAPGVAGDARIRPTARAVCVQLVEHAPGEVVVLRRADDAAA
jgi:hypothetical protein